MPDQNQTILINQETLATNLTNHLTTIETFIQNNPGGVVLTAAQTLVVAQILAGLIRSVLNLLTTTGQG